MKDTPEVPPADRVLDEISAAGYRGTELGPYGYLPRDPAVLRDWLAQRELALTAAYVQINLVDPDARPDERAETMETTRLLAALGCTWVVLSDALFVSPTRAARAGRIRPEDGLQGDDWRRFVANAEAYGRLALEAYGLHAVYHPHVGAYVETGAEVDALLHAADPRYLNLCLDTAHCLYGGDDPVALCRRWGERVRYLHLKECSADVLAAVRLAEQDYFKGVELGVFPELGQGSVDFAAFLDALRAIDFDGWAVVEQDILPGSSVNPLESAQRNLAWLRLLGYDTESV